MSNTSETATSARRINNALVEYRERLQRERAELAHHRNAMQAIRVALKVCADAGPGQLPERYGQALDTIDAIVDAEPESGVCLACISRAYAPASAVFSAKHRPTDEPCPNGHYRSWARIA